jgi:DNA-binding SARP family transcriptional activator/tetratricopeptide (TPR) repeat protein
MWFLLLGEMELQAAGRLLDVGAPRQQAVLAVLVVDAGRPVAIETLIDRVWEDTPPAAARNVLYSHLSRVRGLLRQAGALTGGATVRVERRHAGYVLEVDPDLVDLHRFRRLVEHGRDVRCADAERAEVLTEALSLWRGTPLSGISGGWVAEVRRSWHGWRLDAVTQWAQVELRLGHPNVVITALSDLVDEYPLAESLEVLLMRALQAVGREAEAVERFTTVRQRLADELGVDPGAELRSTYQMILRGELPSPPLADRVVVGSANLASPAQLPPDVYGFAGRDHELRQLDQLLAATGRRSEAGRSAGPPGDAARAARAVVISAIDGTAGIGKTALALHWAHQVADQFRDGQLYVNLGGFDPNGSPVPPAEALRGFLDAFEVPADRLPASFSAQVGLYRSLLADRRVLVLLDNARNAEQVRPLLPGAPGCLVVVTSRNQLSGLVATDGAHPMTLHVPTGAEARELLARRLGERRLAAEPRAVDEILVRCARLPLALAIVAARAATHPRFSLTALAGELGDTRGALDKLAGPDLPTDVRAVFSWSYRQLSPEAARLFRLLGLHPGPDVAPPAAASLAGLTPGKIGLPLAELAQANLVTEHLPGRYTLHDLLRAYATELAHSHDTDRERRAAERRLLDHYLHTAHTAAQLLEPHRDPLSQAPTMGARQPGTTPEELADLGQALTWFAAEHPVLLATVHQGADPDLDTHIWQLAWALTPFLERRGHWHDQHAAHSAALHAARRAADQTGQAHAHTGLARALGRLGRHDDAHTHLRQALDLFSDLGDDTGQAHVHLDLGWLFDLQGLHREAVSQDQDALRLFRAADHHTGQARALNNIGWYHTLLGEHKKTLTYCQRALTLHQQIGNHYGAAFVWHSLGYAHEHLNQHQQATACYQHALGLFRDFGDRYYEATTLIHLGNTHHTAGDLDNARPAWQHALTILDELHHPDAEPLRDRLQHPDQHPTKRNTSADMIGRVDQPDGSRDP